MLLVTGASGFVGRNVVQSLLEKGHKVRALCMNRKEAEKVPKKAEIAIGDITKPQTLISPLRNVDTVIHLAGLVSYTMPREELFRINAIGTRNLLDHCKSAKKFIFASSVSVYGEIKGEADEGYPLTPKTPYGESKRMAEKYIIDSGIPYTILRIAPIYGKGSPNWMKNLSLMERGFPIPRTRKLTHVTHISSAVQAFVKAVEKGSGVYNIAEKDPVPFVTFAEILMRALGKNPRKLPSFMVGIMARTAGMKNYLDVLTINRHYVIRKAERELGYEPVGNFEEEVKQMVYWYKKLRTMTVLR